MSGPRPQTVAGPGSRGARRAGPKSPGQGCAGPEPAGRGVAPTGLPIPANREISANRAPGTGVTGTARATGGR